MGCDIYSTLRELESKSRKGSRKTARVSVVRQAMGRIQALYRIEKRPKNVSPEERHRVRQEQSLPLVEKLGECLDDSIGRVPPQSVTEKATAYLDRKWPILVRRFPTLSSVYW